MFRSVIIEDNQKVTPEDFNNFGNHPRESFDALVRDFGGFPTFRYAGFVVEQTGVSLVRVSPGRIYGATGAGYIFDFENGDTVDLLSNLPATAKRVATIVAYGNEILTELEPRTFQIDPETEETEGRETQTESRREAHVGFVLGVENPTPTPPAIPANYVAIAHVILTPAGVESITQLTAYQVFSNYQAELAVALISGRLNAVGPQLDTLRTDIAGLGVGLQTKTDFEFSRGLAIDIARLKDIARLPDDYVAYATDNFTDLDESETGAAGYAARIYEGLRFPSVASAPLPIVLANPNDPALKIDGNMALPAHTSEIRMTIVAKDSDYPLTNTTSTTKQARTVTESRQVTVATGTEKLTGVQTNTGKILIIEKDRGDGHAGVTQSLRAGEVPSGYVQKSTTSFSNGESQITYERPTYSTSTTTSKRTEFVEVVTNITGSFTAQTFLNSQEGFLTEIDLYFSKKNPTGDVQVMLCDVDIAGNPMLDRVLERTTLLAADINVWPAATSVKIKPAHLVKGARYAIVLASSAPHFICQVTGNKFAQGALFYLQDEVFVPAAAGVDMAMQLKFAKFAVAQAIVGLEPLELGGGIDMIKINQDVAVPDGCQIIYQIRVNNEWRSLQENMDINLFANLPSLLQFRAILIGTTDCMPAMGLGASRSEVILSRPLSAFTHVSKARVLAAPTDKIEVELRIENWDGAGGHSHGCTLLAGPTYTTVETADATATEASIDGAATIKRYTFNVVDVSQFKIKQTGARGASAKVFHVSERLDTEFA